jgi:hypothetical protein
LPAEPDEQEEAAAAATCVSGAASVEAATAAVSVEFSLASPLFPAFCRLAFFNCSRYSSHESALVDEDETEFTLIKLTPCGRILGRKKPIEIIDVAARL